MEETAVHPSLVRSKGIEWCSVCVGVMRGGGGAGGGLKEREEGGSEACGVEREEISGVAYF